MIFRSVFVMCLFLFTLSSNLFADNLKFLKDTLPVSELDGLVVALSRGQFDENLDVLNYAAKLQGSKPKNADVNEISFSYKFANGLKVSFQHEKSSANITRKTIPKNLSSNTKGDSFSISYPIVDRLNRNLELELFYKENSQDPLVLDCYEFNSIVIGGSCPEAKIRFLDAEIYKSSGDLVYKPVLTTEASLESFGFNLRLKNSGNGSLNVYHSLSVERLKILHSYQSDLLSSKDTFLRGSRLGNISTGELIDQFIEDLPQNNIPWFETSFTYSLNANYAINEKIAFMGRLSFLKISRKDYIKNPQKKDYNDNQLIDAGFFYKASNTILLYSRLSLSSHYLLGVNPLSYNRRSNHLFDNPYGQVYVGALINF